jgi:hypothetical protein
MSMATTGRSVQTKQAKTTKVVKENGQSGLRAKTMLLLAKMRREGEPIWYLKTSGSAFQRAGVPDVLVIYRGRAGTLELKAPGNEPTEPQKHELRWVAKAYGVAGWADSMEGVRAFLEMLKTPPVMHASAVREAGDEPIKFE